MSSLSEWTPQGQRVAHHRPWPRIVVDAAEWSRAILELVSGRWALASLWGDKETVHMAMLEPHQGEIVVLSLDCPNGSFPAVGLLHPPALRLERTIHDLYGLVAEGSPDQRPWLDRDQWGVQFPLGPRVPSPPPRSYEFLPVEGEGLHQIAVGPVHAGIIEPGHFRFTANGETVARLEQRLGYVHKGIDQLMIGADLVRGAELAQRVSGDSTVAYAYAFCRAAEASLAIEPPPRALAVRALCAELERLANHLGDIGAICNDAAFALMLAHCGVLRENVLRAADKAFGHRLMREVIVPGGVSRDLDAAGKGTIRQTVKTIRQRFPELIELYDETASLQDRTVATGVLDPALAEHYAAGGYVGRASGRAFDARKKFCYPPYDTLRFDMPVLSEGDVNARVWIRIREVEQSVALVEQLLGDLPDGELTVPLPPCTAPAEGLALVEGFRGDVLVWLRLADGVIERGHLRDPSWFQWPLLEAAIEGNIVADFPLCNKSFNCSYSGVDL